MGSEGVGMAIFGIRGEDCGFSGGEKVDGSGEDGGPGEDLWGLRLVSQCFESPAGSTGHGVAGSSLGRSSLYWGIVQIWGG